MKKIVLLLLVLCSQFQSSNAQVYPFYDAYESYTPFNVPTGYTGDITVYLSHGASGSKGLAGYLTSFTNKDSLVFPVIGPLLPFSVLELEWRLMDPFLYPSTAATIAPGDSFNILLSTDSVTWTSIFTINSSNFPGATTFEKTIIPLDSYSGQTVLLKIKGTRANGSAEFFIDVDNVYVDIPGKIGQVKELESFSIFPNPASDFINFSNAVPITGNLQIIDFAGRIVVEKEVQNSTSGQVEISNLSSGNYLLTVKTQKGRKIYPVAIR